MSGDWADLPIDLLHLIANRIEDLKDFIVFTCVCTSWKNASPKDKFDVFTPQVPLLMLADKDSDYRQFYSLSKKKVSSIFLPEARGRPCFPSEGWLCTMENNTGEMNLLHPLSRTQIHLPSRENLMASNGLGDEQIWTCIEKVVLSASPCLTSDYVLVVHYHANINHLAFWRPGDLNWTHIKCRRFGAITGINYYKGHFYFVTCMGQFWVFEVAGPTTSEPIVEPRLLFWSEDKTIFRRPSVQFYLVELSDALLFVIRFAHYSNGGHKTFKFKVVELDLIEGELKEKEIKTLGDSAFFLGFNTGACCIDSSKFSGIKPNHIYFTDDWNDILEGGGGKDTGVYNYEDGQIESIYPGLSLSLICPPTWIMPYPIM
uniref:F-box domain-containing protein n=1 Tax=Solanum lycopersicum TaxID=4081 RepID=A0A3Q7HWU6_SOLLC|nr:putative F-box protein At3g25750 [Solanum lycopersicum]